MYLESRQRGDIHQSGGLDSTEATNSPEQNETHASDIHLSKARVQVMIAARVLGDRKSLSFRAFAGALLAAPNKVRRGAACCAQQGM